MEKKPHLAEGGDLRSPDATPQPVQKASANDIDSIPNGGWRAYSQVAGTFFIYFNTWGVLNTFGAYQGYYETQAVFSSTPSNISWVGSIQAFLLLVVGLVTGPLYDAGYFRAMLYTGSFLIVFGQMMVSLCNEYYQVLLAQGFCIGLGMGLIFIPGVAILSSYFSTKLPVMNGIANSGGGLGGTLYPIIFHRLSETIGFRWTSRVLAFMILATLLIPILLFRPRIQPSTSTGRRKILDLPAFKEPAYTTFVLGGLVAFIAINVPFFYLQTFSLTQNITNSLGFYTLSIMNTGSVIGRIFPNIVANAVGPFNILGLWTVIAGAVILALINLSNLPGLIVVAALYGFFSGGVVSLPPTCFVQLSPDRSLIGTRMGMGYAVITIGNLIGAPIAGAIVQNLGFNATWIFEGCVMIAGGVVMGVSRRFRGGKGGA